VRGGKKGWESTNGENDVKKRKKNVVVKCSTGGTEKSNDLMGVSERSSGHDEKPKRSMVQKKRRKGVTHTITYKDMDRKKEDKATGSPGS